MLRNGYVIRRAVGAVLLVLALSGCSPEWWVRHEFALVGATEAEQDQAVAVAWCESRLVPDVRSASGTFDGLFQIGWRYHHARAEALGFTRDDMLRASPNAAVAASLWRDAGWAPWECRP